MTASDTFLRLREVRLERFKAAFKPEPIAVGDFQLIIGRNGAGKSTLLEALQWLDRTLRQDARAACDRYFGIRDLINMRSRAGVPYFELTLTWTIERPSAAKSNLTYTVRVEQGADNKTPLVAAETLYEQVVGTKKRAYLIKTRNTKREAGKKSGTRVVYPDDPNLRTNFEEPDRLALARGGMRSRGQGKPHSVFDLLQDFWSRAVFLRLSPNRLVAGSPADRRSFDPILDEEGQTLPALLNELSKEQMADLSKDLGASVNGIEGVKVIGKSRTSTAEDKINYQLRERMPYVGRAGSTAFSVPSWMLSEGTRRLTAIFALLVRSPPPLGGRPNPANDGRLKTGQRS